MTITLDTAVACVNPEGRMRMVGASLLLAVVTASASVAAEIPASPEDIQPLKTGDEIPSVTLKTPSGEGFDLKEAVAARKSVLIFYRGGW